MCQTIQSINILNASEDNKSDSYTSNLNEDRKICVINYECQLNFNENCKLKRVIEYEKTKQIWFATGKMVTNYLMTMHGRILILIETKMQICKPTPVEKLANRALTGNLPMVTVHSLLAI